MSEESPSVYKLPLEVMGLILLKLGNPSEQRFDEIKKCQLISPRWYKAVQVLFQDHFFQKYLTHFDGFKYTYGQSRRFGLNIFGSFPLNFSTFKISNSELYLMKNLLANLMSTNLQNLILEDNLLNLKELLQVLKMFPNIVRLEFVQSDIYEDWNVSKKICQLYANPDDKSDLETIEIIKNELAGTENFLSNLKIISFKIIHPSVLNFLILIISCAQCELEEISIVFNIFGVIYSVYEFKSNQIEANEANIKHFELGPTSMIPLNKFSKSLKKIKITAKSSSMATKDYRHRSHILQIAFSRLVQSIFNIFNENQLKDLKNIEELQISIWKEQFCQNQISLYGLLNFIKSQNNLPNVEVGVISESFKQGPNQGQSQEVRLQLKKTFLESLSSLGVKFWCEISKFGLDPIIPFSENLTNLKVKICSTSNWRFSDHKVVFPNCESLIIINDCYNNQNPWPNFEVPFIVKKFPILKILKIEDTMEWNDTGRPQVVNEDLQIIIKNLPNLEILSLSSILDVDDSGLTGLTSEALELRKNSPNLPITPEERPGLPISHLKNLVELSISKDWMAYDYDILADPEIRRPNPHKITDFTPIYGFEYETPKLKRLIISFSNITDSGIDALKRKLPSSCRLTVDPS